MKREREEEKAEEVLKERDEMGVDEIDMVLDGKVLCNNLPSNRFGFAQLRRPKIFKGAL